MVSWVFSESKLWFSLMSTAQLLADVTPHPRHLSVCPLYFVSPSFHPPHTGVLSETTGEDGTSRVRGSVAGMASHHSPCTNV